MREYFSLSYVNFRFFNIQRFIVWRDTSPDTGEYFLSFSWISLHDMDGVSRFKHSINLWSGSVSLRGPLLFRMFSVHVPCSTKRRQILFTVFTETLNFFAVALSASHGTLPLALSHQRSIKSWISKDLKSVLSPMPCWYSLLYMFLFVHIVWYLKCSPKKLKKKWYINQLVPTVKLMNIQCCPNSE